MKRLVIALVLVSVLSPVYAQTIASAGSGPWNNAATWVGGIIPDFSNSTQIRIENGHVVNIPNGYSLQVDQLQIRIGGQLVIDNGGLVDVVNASGNDLVIFTGSPNGSLVIDGTLELSQGATITNFDGVSHGATTAGTVSFQDNGVYRHKYTTSNGSIPVASWAAGSTVQITGYTSNASRPLNLAQAFHHFIWNCPGQTGIIDLKGNLATVNGDLQILSTGGAMQGNLRLSYADNGIVMNVAGNLTISGQSGVWFTGTGTGNTVNIGGDLVIENSINQLIAREGNATINCRGLSITNPAGSLSMASNVSAFSTINLSGDLNVQGALNAGSGSGSVNFVGTAPTVQTISGSGAIGNINFAVMPGAILDVGTNSIRGSGSFTLNAGSELRVGDLNASGAIQNSTTAGNIRVPISNRFYNNTSTIVYNGAGAQTIGSGHPNVNTRIATNTSLSQNNLTINTLTLQSGTLSAGNRTLNVLGNWNAAGGTFAPGTGAVVFNGTTTIQGIGPFSFSTFNVGPTGNVTLPAATLSVGANLNLNASSTVSAGASTILLNGNSGQTINVNSKTLNNITINKSGGEVILISNLFVQGILNIQSNSTLRTYGLLTLLSTNDNPAQDGSIAALPAGASIVGNVTVQRYMSTAGNYDRFISMPISNATVAQLQDNFPVTGDFTGTSYPCTGCVNNGPSLERYNETLLGAFSNGYVQVPAVGGSNTAQLTPGVGYDAYMWNGATPITWDVTGTINRNTINFSVSHTASSPAVPTADGWNLVGNPYPSPIQWSNGAGWSKTNIDPTVWVWDVVGRVWHSYNANTQSGDLTNGIIALGQGFWVRVPVAAPASMSINEQAKSTIGSGNYYRQGKTADDFVVTLSRGPFSDNAFMFVSYEATKAFDQTLDCPKLELGIERMHVSFVEDGHHLAFLGISEQDRDKEIPIRIVAEEEGDYQLSFSLSRPDLFEGYYLLDVVQNEATGLDNGTKISFKYQKSDPDRRFVITRNISVSTLRELRVELYPNPTSDIVTLQVSGGSLSKIELINTTGSLIESHSPAPDSGAFRKSFSLADQPSGVYFIKIITEGTIVIKRVVKF